MTAKLSFPTERPRIAIFRALQLGDMLCAVPALQALRAAWPAASITLVGLPWATAFIERYPTLIDELQLFPGAIGFPEQAETDAGLAGFYRHMQARHFDLALQLHGSGGIANEIMLHWGASRYAGFVQENEVDRGSGFMAWPDTLPEPQRYTALMEFLGLKVEQPDLNFALLPEDLAACAALLEQYRLEPERLVCVHPGARLPSRRWPAERFAQVADALAQAGWQIALTGSAGDTEVTQKVALAMRQPAVDLTDATELGTLGALLSQARLLICNDTGVSHVAAGVKAPSVVIASGSDTRRWAPLDSTLHRVLAHHPTCRPCAYFSCPFEHACALGVTVDEVVRAALRQLDTCAAIATASAPASFATAEFRTSFYVDPRCL
jgi:ADP-heptose:LPS heptosyltransferase